jgi:hypothetical protein
MLQINLRRMIDQFQEHVCFKVNNSQYLIYVYEQ